MLNEREQAAHDPTIAETAQGLSLAFEKLKADISQSHAARFVLAVPEKLKGAIQMEKTLKTGKIGQFGEESRITYGGVKWVVLDARPKMSLCLAEDVLKDENGEVRYMAFDTDNKNDFAASSARAFLNGDFLEELAAAGADKEAFVPIVLDLTSDDGLDELRHGSAKDRAYTDQMYALPQNHSESVGRLLDLIPRFQPSGTAIKVLCAMSTLRARWTTAARTTATGACVRFAL